MICERIHLKEKFPFLASDGCDPILDLYLPRYCDADDRIRPFLLICPGGGYCFVSEREAEPVALKFLSQGFAVGVLTYSVSPNRFPHQIREAAAAVQMVYDNASVWRCDTNRIAIMGFSAGGHLAAHYGTSYDCPEVREVLPESKPVNAMILCYPVITTETAICHDCITKNLMGKDELSKEQTNALSLERAVSGNTPPAFMWHTAEDRCVHPANSLRFAEALGKYDIPYELHIYPAGEHGLATFEDKGVENRTKEVLHSARWMKDAVDWIKLTFNMM